MAVQHEKVEQAHIVQLLRTFGWQAYVAGTRRRRGDYQGTMQTPGIPDVFAFVQHPTSLLWRLLFVECKASGGRLRPEQALFRDYCVAAGIAHVVGDLDAVIVWLVETGHASPANFPHYRQPKARVV